MRRSTQNNTEVYQVITLQFLLVFLSISSIANSFSSNDDNGIWSMNCRRCKVYIRAGVGGVPGAPPDTSSSGKKPNVGVVVGFTLLLVVILVAAFVCIYRMRRSTSEGSVRQARVLVQPGVVRQENLPQQRVVRPGIHRDEKREGQKQGVAQTQRGEQGNVILPPPPPPPPLAVKDAEEKQRKQQRRREKQQVPLPPPPPPLPTWAVRVREEKRRGMEGTQVQPLPPPPPPPPVPSLRDVVVTEENKRRDERMKEGRKGKQQEPPPPPPPRDVRVREQKRRGVEGKQQQPLPPPPPLPSRDVGVAKQKKRVGKGRQQQPPSQDVEISSLKIRGGEGQQQDRLQDVGLEKRKKRGREGKQQALLDEDVARPFKKEKEEKYQHYLKDDVAEQREKGGVMGKKAYDENSSRFPRKYAYSYLNTITNEFHKSNKIGRGGYGSVYKGTLPNGTMVAVKCLTYGGMIDDFNNEVQALARADHPNLVKLIGYCDDGILRILVYEYMRRGSLNKWIFHSHPKRSLSWPAMKNVIQGIAQGLEYLHEKCEKKILHRDLKPANVILDEDMNAKLCDFGLAKLINKDQSSATPDWVPLGTYDYMAPEARQNKRVTDKFDVYSFGVVVLEVVFGKHYQELLRFELSDLIRNLNAEMQRNVEELDFFVKLTVSCLRENPKDRPSMSAILAEIQGLNEKTRRN